MNYAIVTVLYNRTLEACETWKTLLQTACGCEDCHVIAADNSTDAKIRAANRRLTADLNAANQVTYLDMEGNAGLPAAYNRALDLLQPSAENPNAENTPSAGREAAERGGETWVILTDQDTVFPPTYLDDIRRAAEESAADVLAPVVRSGEVYLSPCRQNRLRFVPISAEDLRRPAAEQAGGIRDLEQGGYFINSGLVIRGRLFWQEQLRYNQNLFLDFTDFDLINRIRALPGAPFRILPDTILQQRFSGLENKTAEEDLRRYRQYLHDGTVFYQTWHPGEKRAASLLKGRGWKLAWRHRDIRFLKKS